MRLGNVNFLRIIPAVFFRIIFREIVLSLPTMERTLLKV